MINEVKNFLKKYNLLAEQKTFVVGFSGGYDSMCMLDVLHRISQKIPFRLIALHINHNWRPKEAEVEQENCENYCRSKNIELIVEKLDDSVAKTETAAREKDESCLKNIIKNTMRMDCFLLIQNQTIRKRFCIAFRKVQA